MEEKEYKVAILSYAEKCALESKNIKLTSYSKLADNKYIKAGYTKRSGGYGIIALFDGDKPTMIIQIIDSEPQLAVEKWLNYLSLILPSNEQKKADGDNIKGFEIHTIEKLIEIWNALFKSEDFKKLQQIEELTPKEIRGYRDYIKTLPEDERADWYLELQKKVPYHNQRDNESLATEEDVENNSSWLNDGDTAGDIMCNLTSEAMCLEYLGITCPDSSMQFEDYLEQLRIENDFEKRTNYKARKSLANELGVCYEKKDFDAKFCAKKEAFIKYCSDKLAEGSAIMISVWPACKGHLVRLQAIEENGIVVDDPYGKVKGKTEGFDWRENCNSGGYNKNEKTAESTIGSNVKWEWTDIADVTIKYVEVYSICK